MPYPFSVINRRLFKRALAWLAFLVPLLAIWTQDGGTAAGPQSPGLSMPEAIRHTLDEESHGLASLHARLETASTDADALAIEREVERLKAASELALLRIQAQEARHAGRIALAEEIERAIDAVLHPQIPLVPSSPSRVESGSNTH